jgi:hypothetical protein
MQSDSPLWVPPPGLGPPLDGGALPHAIGLADDPSDHEMQRTQLTRRFLGVPGQLHRIVRRLILGHLHPRRQAELRRSRAIDGRNTYAVLREKADHGLARLRIV